MSTYEGWKKLFSLTIFLITQMESKPKIKVVKKNLMKHFLFSSNENGKIMK